MTDARIVCKCFGVFLHFEEEVEEAKKQIKLDMELLRTRTSAHKRHVTVAWLVISPVSAGRSRL